MLLSSTLLILYLLLLKYLAKLHSHHDILFIAPIRCPIQIPDGSPNILTEFGQYAKNQYDYDDIEYPIPFNVLYNNISTHYMNFGKPIVHINNIVTGELPQFSHHPSDILAMTGATENHALGSFNCLFSIVLDNPFASILYINYGISAESYNTLIAHFHSIQEIQTKLKSNAFIAYREFNWNNFPSWINLTGNPTHRGGYAWKMIAFSDAFFEWKAFIAWLDGGSVIIDTMNREVSAARQFGFFSPASAGKIGKWVHKDSMDFLIKHKFISTLKQDRFMASGGHIFAYWKNKTIVDLFMYPYKQCAFTQKCVTPRTANMSNHRQDQAIVSALIAELDIPRSADGKYHYIPALRNERGNNEKATKTILFNLWLNIQNLYNIKFSSTIYNTSAISYTRQKYKFSPRMTDELWP